MSTISVSGMPGRSPGRVRTAPRFLLTGKRRKAVQKLLHYLNVVSSQDTSENLRAENLDYAPFIVRGSGGSTYARAFSTLVQRCTDCLAAKG